MEIGKHQEDGLAANCDARETRSVGPDQPIVAIVLESADILIGPWQIQNCGHMGIVHKAGARG
jgi:hypothetical protein